MRISVYLKPQDHLQDCAPHETSRTIAASLLALSVARPVGQNAIQLTRDMTWKEAKRLLKWCPMETESSNLLPPLDWYFPWTDLPLWLIRTYAQHKLAA